MARLQPLTKLLEVALERERERERGGGGGEKTNMYY